MQYKKSLECLIASGALIIAANTAFGQTAPPPASAPETATNAASIQTVMVTANRVRSNAQTTAVALSVYSGSALADAGVSSIAALQTIDPSVNVTSSSGAAYVAIRGIASTDVTEIGDPSVPIARDGFFTNRSFGIVSSMYDIERVEVLKGPQGTLFGRGSTGGLINIITQKPRESLGGYLQAEVGNYHAVNLEGAVNVPLSDKVQMRFSAISRKHDGYREVTGIDIRGDDEDNRSARLQMAFQPFDGFEGWVSYQKDHSDQVGEVTKALPLRVVSPIGDTERFAGAAASSTRLDGQRTRWEFSYNRLPAGLTLTYAGGYDKQDYRRTNDITGPAYPAVRQFMQREIPTTTNHEVRIATPMNRRFSGQMGYFYFSEENIIDSGILVGAMNPGATPSFTGQYGIKFDYNVNTRTDGLFGQVGWKLTESLKLTAGARHSRDEKVRTGRSLMTLGALANPALNVPPRTVLGNGALDGSKPTFQLGFDWTPTAHNFVYGKIATGYKAGGFNSNGSGASVPYAEETVRSLELGTKNRFFDRRLQFNAALFHQDYKGYQSQQSAEVLNGAGGVFNVGDAKIKGLEAELIATIPDVARFDLNMTALRARFGDNIRVREGSSPPVEYNVGGNDLPNAPKLAVTAGVQRSVELGNGELMGRLSAKYSSEYYFSVFNHADTTAPAVTTVNALLSYKLNSGDWEFQGYVNNLTDEAVLANSSRNFVSQRNTMQFQPPRTFGVRMRYKY